jgi:hypothetical protein
MANFNQAPLGQALATVTVPSVAVSQGGEGEWGGYIYKDIAQPDGVTSITLFSGGSGSPATMLPAAGQIWPVAIGGSMN